MGGFWDGEWGRNCDTVSFHLKKDNYFSALIGHDLAVGCVGGNEMDLPLSGV